MNRSGFFLLLSALGLAACQDSPNPTAPRPQLGGNAASISAQVGEPIPGQYIVVFKDEVRDVPEAATRLIGQHGGTKRFTYTHALKGFSAQLPDAAVAALRRDPSVAYIEQDQVMRAITEQTGATWGIDRVDQRDLPLNGTYVYNADGTGVTAYIIDTGIRFDHVEFGGRAVKGFDAVTSGGTAADCNGHGTHVSGTVGGATYGIAKNVRLVAVRVLDCNGSGTTSGVIAGIDWVTADHAAGAPAAANMSLGGGASTSLDNAVINSINDGVTYGIAAGNSNADACNYSPARAGPALTVAATTSTDARASFSNYGTCVDIFAPGSSITSAWYTSSTATNTISGTSMATPHVVGAAALYLQTNPTATPAQVEAALEGNATTGRVTSAGTGSPNLLLYTAFISAGPPPPPPAAPSDLAANAVDQQRIDLTWTDNSDNESGFELQRSTDGFATFTVINVGANVTSFQNTGLAASTTYTYRVLAKNAGGSSDFSNTATATTSAPPPNSPPVARYTWSCTGVPQGRNCSFNATSSTDDKGISSYAWTFGDGTTGTGAIASHRFGSRGTHNVTLTLTDTDGATGSIMCAVQTATTGTCAPAP
jgi:subtilisin family serine protease